MKDGSERKKTRRSAGPLKDQETQDGIAGRDPVLPIFLRGTMRTGIYRGCEPPARGRQRCRFRSGEGTIPHKEIRLTDEADWTRKERGSRAQNGSCSLEGGTSFLHSAPGPRLSSLAGLISPATGASCRKIRGVLPARASSHRQGERQAMREVVSIRAPHHDSRVRLWVKKRPHERLFRSCVLPLSGNVSCWFMHKEDWVKSPYHT